MKKLNLTLVSSLDYGQSFLDPESGLRYTVAAIAGPDAILADADKGPDMFFPLDYKVIV